MSNELSLLLEKHKELDYLCRNPGDKVFISDWYCRHPFTKKYLPEETFKIKQDWDLLYYCFQNDTLEIHEEIRIFHEKNDGVIYADDEIYVGAGTTGLLTAQMLMLVSMGVSRIWYTKPLYYIFYYFANIFNIELIPVCEFPLNQTGIDMRLPNESSWLIVCDPIWFMGRSISAEYIEQIKEWQAKTGSHIIVDGAFQYMKWDINKRNEPTSGFDKDLTLRTLCPTKSLALHGVRFSYTLVPKRYWEDMRYAYANSFGSSCVFSHYAAKRIMKVLNSAESNIELLKFIQARYRYFLKRDVFIDDIGAEETYFIFVKMKGDTSRYICMDQDFFDTINYPNYVRFNVLLPHDI